MDSLNDSDMHSTGSIPYDTFFSLSIEGVGRYGSIFDLPVAEEPYSYLTTAYRREYPGGKILDFGCGAQKVLRNVLDVDNGLYFGCDSDPAAEVPFRSLDEIPHELQFQIVVANQVLEHLAFSQVIQHVLHLGRLVAPGGILLLSVPNPQHPTRHLSNPTHLTPLNYLNLYALLTLAGMETIRCVRCNKVPGPRWYERPMVNMMCRVFRMDWCDTVYAVGRRGP